MASFNLCTVFPQTPVEEKHQMNSTSNRFHHQWAAGFQRWKKHNSKGSFFQKTKLIPRLPFFQGSNMFCLISSSMNQSWYSSSSVIGARLMVFDPIIRYSSGKHGYYELQTLLDQNNIKISEVTKWPPKKNCTQKSVSHTSKKMFLTFLPCSPVNSQTNRMSTKLWLGVTSHGKAQDAKVIQVLTWFNMIQSHKT